MTADVRCYYRSSHPDVLAAWHDTQQRYREAHAAIGAFAKRHNREATAYKSRRYRIASLVGEKPEGPWRYAARIGGWIPHRGSKAGKALGTEWDALSCDNLGNLPGMPSNTHGNDMFSLVSPGMFEADGAVWLEWRCSHDAVESSGWGKPYDPATWERAKASAYHLARESTETTNEAEVAR